MRNGIKIVWQECEKQPNLTQQWPKTDIFDFFGFSKTPYDSNEISYNRSTPYFGPMSARASKLYDWDSIESE